jgi:hypothetical protein
MDEEKQMISFQILIDRREAALSAMRAADEAYIANRTPENERRLNLASAAFGEASLAVLESAKAAVSEAV